MDATKTLSDAQLLILTTAAQRPNRMVLPLPPSLRARGASQRTLLTSLLRRGLVEEQPTETETLNWRHDAQGQRHALRITPAGLAAINGVADVSTAPAPAPACHMEVAAVGVTATAPQRTEESPALPVSPGPRPGGKLGQVLDAIASEAGATLAELVSLTGWQPHTTRAALTRLRQRGFNLRLASSADRKTYRVQHTAQA